MRTPKITLLVLLLVFALASIAIGYALWSKTLRIDSTTNTGTVSAQWLPAPNAFTNDPPGTIDPGKDKDVGRCTLAVDPLDDNIMNITVDNGYPSYDCMAALKFHNNGTVPVKIAAIGCVAPPEITCAAVDGPGDVVNPSVNKSVNVDIHVEQAAAQSLTYTCQCTIDLKVWNDP